MAQTIEEITADLDNAKASQLDLSGLYSYSNTAVWKLWRNVVAQVMFNLETLWDFYKLEVAEIVSKQPPGTLMWYVDQMYSFQLGDLLVFINNQPTYETINVDNQLIKRASAIVASDGTVVIKVATLDGDDIIPLDSGELSAAQGYLDQIKFAGTKTILTSLAADDIRVIGDVYYSSTLELSTLKDNVFAAINSYLAAVPFNGIIYTSKIEDAIQSVAGIVDVVIGSVQARNGSDPFAFVGRYYLPLAGYAQEDSGSPFSSTLQFTSSVV